MKHELIKTEDYLLIVSDEGIKKYDWVFHPTYKSIYQWIENAEIKFDRIDAKKIIAHLPLSTSPYLDGVDVLPEIEYDLHIYDAIGYAGSEGHPDPQAFSDRQMALFQGYADGYEKAKETYKYTFEDMMKCWNKGAMDGRALNDEVHNDVIAFNFIKSLSQPKLPIAFESNEYGVGNDENGRPVIESRTFTNSEGRTEWIGNYLF
jgi:hypothetical protein